MNLDLAKTKAALPEWEADTASHHTALHDVKTEDQWFAWLAREKEINDKLRSAFADDTSDRNSRSTCMMIPAADIAHLAKTGSWK